MRPGVSFSGVIPIRYSQFFFILYPLPRFLARCFYQIQI